MVNYSETLKQLEKDGVNIYRLVAQVEAEYFFPVGDFDQDTVDRIASYIYDWICNSEASAVEVARMLSREFQNGNIELEKVLDFDQETEDYLNDVISQYC